MKKVFASTRLSPESARRMVPLFLFGSGFCALIYQTTWLREFRLIFGGSTAASAAVCGVFMAGLGFGGIVLGRRSERQQPLAFYGRLELIIALSAALSPFLISGARALYIAFGGTAALGPTGGNIVRLCLASVILGLPTFAMGGTLPAAARAMVTPNDTGRRSLGLIYGCNTLGAVAGALAGTFYLFENFGNHLTLWWAAGLNALVALCALHYRATPLKGAMNDDETPSPPVTNRSFVFTSAAIVGFAFFLMEIVWFRMLAPLLGGTTFSFGLILACALLGIGLGGVSYAVFNLRRAASLNLFALSCAAEAFFIALPYALGDRIAMATMLMHPLGTLGFYGHVIAWLEICLLVVFPAAFISGIQFPLLIALLGCGRAGVGGQTGAAYACNTIGALLGSLSGGFGFLPLFSAPGLWKLLVALLAALAIIAAAFELLRTGRLLRLLAPIATAAAALLLLSAVGPTAFWRHSQIGIGHLQQYQGSPNEMHELVNRIRRQVRWEQDGVESSVALANPDGAAFIVNGKSDGNAKADAATQIMSGLIGAALHPRAQDVMVIGLGTGSTAGWLAAVPSIERVDAVELESSILRVAQECAAVNQNALGNSKLHVSIGDGREQLLTSRDNYDLIVSEPSNPYRAGVANLFTRDFYRSVQNRLRPDGLFLQWIQTYDIDDRTIEILYRTLGSVFPQIDTWQTQEGDLLLVASLQPLQLDVTRLRERLATEPFRSALRVAWSATNAEDFLAHHIANNDVARALQQIGDGPLNTDDRTVIEFAIARSLSSPDGFCIGNVRAGAEQMHRDRPLNLRGAVDWSRVQEAKLGFLSLAPAEVGRLACDQRARAEALCAYEAGDLTGASRHWRSQRQEPQTLPELRLVAETLAEQGAPAALRYLDSLGEFVSGEADALRSEYYLRTSQPQAAAQSLALFFKVARRDPWLDHDILRRSIARSEEIARATGSLETARTFYTLLDAPLAIWNCESQRRIALVALATQMESNRPGNYTATALKPFEPNVCWNRNFLELRRACFEARSDPRLVEANRDLDDFLGQEPLSADTIALAKLLRAASALPASDERRDLSARTSRRVHLNVP